MDRLKEGDLLGPDDPRVSYGLVDGGAPLPPMVDFRGHDGRSLAVPYAQVLSIAMDHGVAIELAFPDHRIIIRGRNLAPLYQRFVEQRVTFVQEGDLDVLSEAETFVDSIVLVSTEVGE